MNDGSADASGAKLERAATREPRLRVVHIPPSGLPAALNIALAHARGSLIARHDADDHSHRLRFALRRNALERVGGWTDRDWPEDLDLWLRMLGTGCRFAKLPRVLYGWRQHAISATRRDPRYRRERFLDLRRETIERGLLRGSRHATVIGVGDSLETWRKLLSNGMRTVRAVAAGRPSPRMIAALAPPVVFVFGAPSARMRWRDALGASALSEGGDFVFVA